MEAVNKNEFSVGVFWKLCEQFGPNIVNLLLSIVLARLLSPDDYGMIAVATIFLNFCDILIQHGFCTALVQKKEFVKLDYFVAMTLSICVAIVLYIVVFFCAPLIAKFYNMPRLSELLRVLGIMVIFNSIGSILTAYMTKLFKFKLMFIIHMIASTISGALGIASAYYGVGVWALVIQRASQQLLYVGCLVIILKWNFKPVFDKESAKSTVRFGMKILGGAVISFVGDNAYSMAIAKSYSSADLGLESRAESLPNALLLGASNSMAHVVLPTVAAYQEDASKVLSSTRRIVKVASYLIMPMTIGMFAVAKPLIYVVYGEAYLGAAELLQCLCLFYLPLPTLFICGSVIKAIGKGKVFMFGEILKTILTIASVFVFTLAWHISIIYFVLIKGIVEFVLLAYYLIFTKKYFDYGLFKHLKDILAAVLLCAAMYGGVYGIAYAMQSISMYISLFVEVFAGAVIYIVLSVIFRIDSFYELLDIAKNLLQKIKGLYAKKPKEDDTHNNDAQNNDKSENSSEVNV